MSTHRAIQNASFSIVPPPATPILKFLLFKARSTLYLEPSSIIADFTITPRHFPCGTDAIFTSYFCVFAWICRTRGLEISFFGFGCRKIHQVRIFSKLSAASIKGMKNVLYFQSHRPNETHF